MEKSKIADNIRRLIDAKGYKHMVIAERAGYTKQQFSDMLNGRKIIAADDLIPLRDAIGCSYNDFFRKPEGQA